MREFQRAAIFIFACLVIGILPAPRANASEAKPNFVFILCDDLGYGDLGCYGNPIIQTPNLDRLASEGIRFTDCYSASPVCSPSRAGILTGRWPDRAGMHEIVTGGSAMHLGANQVSVAILLKQAGYSTAIFGKWHLSGQLDGTQPTPQDHGFDHWFCTLDNAVPSHRNPGNFELNGVSVGQIKAFSNDILIQQTLNWLVRKPKGTKQRAPSKESFCIFLWLHSPHERVNSPPELVELYAKDHDPLKADYYANVTHIDRAVGRLLDEFKTMGLDQNTMVMFTSDNGPESPTRYHGADRSHGSAGPFRASKLHLYEGGIRVPGIVRWPLGIQPGQIIATPICGLDVLPTLCELAGAIVPQDLDLDGVSFAPLLSGSELHRERPLYWQNFRALGGPKAAMRVGDYKILAGWDGPEFPYWEPVTHELQLTIANAHLKNFELYDLKDDPGESRNLIGQSPLLDGLLACSLQLNWEKPERDWPPWP